MEFKTYWLSLKPEQRKSFADRCGYKVGYLDHVSTGYRKASVHKLAPKIERESGGQVTRQELRPDVFGEAPATPAPAHA